MTPHAREEGRRRIQRRRHRKIAGIIILQMAALVLAAGMLAVLVYAEAIHSYFGGSL